MFGFSSPTARPSIFEIAWWFEWRWERHARLFKKTAGRISTGWVALGWLGGADYPLRAPVAETLKLCDSTNKILTRTTQFKQCVLKSTVRFLNNIRKIDSDRPRLRVHCSHR